MNILTKLLLVGLQNRINHIKVDIGTIRAYQISTDLQILDIYQYSEMIGLFEKCHIIDETFCINKLNGHT